MSGGAWTQVSRLSTPLVNEVVIGLPDKDRFNASQPKDDAQFAKYVTNPTLPALLDVLFRNAVNSALGTSFASIAPSNLPRNDLVTAFLAGGARAALPAACPELDVLRVALHARRLPRGAMAGAAWLAARAG